MASEEWKGSMSASCRYDNIERISNKIISECPEKKDIAQQEAFRIENDAFDASSTREEYDEACNVSFHPASVPRQESPPSFLIPNPIGKDDNGDSIGVRIGPYQGCVPVGEGLTSTVYRANSPSSTPRVVHALKVIHPYQTFEPHNPQREVKILRSLHHPAAIALVDSFRDQEQRLVLTFPFKPLTLADLFDAGPVSVSRTRSIFRDILSALSYIHARGIIHRDIKPSAILLDTFDGPAYLSDFGTAWHPDFSPSSEPPDSKILDIGTGPYRPPDALFGNKAYSTQADMWSLGVLLSESASTNPMHPSPIFESPPTHEDGSQLGLILSIFRTLGTPTPETWPEATRFRTTPFGMWRVFEARDSEVVFEGVKEEFKGLVARLLRFESSERFTAEQALQQRCMQQE
ncbi:Cell division protein kinase [Scedosporium apiospermum]|uniref:cyclin-dependent kinase n=1 Tax=Pseudallescheria apiosperma TaxID=563466 RepID=A0A084FZL4_PSEDA|nr:Cell division protein kinase [Scedosporium apiospermum]KEZ40526.1 Cell division protein kinase [Scedosporium apiospermum]